jgi:predicted alpha/beta hydrolase family esterase
MTKQRPAAEVLFVQGGGSGTHDSWDDKLVSSLEKELGAGYTIRYPRMPNEAEPEPTTWKQTIDRELATLSDGVILVGHSVGAAILLDHLAEGAPKRRLAGVFLIATPFIGDGGWPSDDLRPTKELVGRLPPGVPLYFYHGGDDETVPLSHAERFEQALPHATVRRLAGRDHQLNDELREVAHDIEGLR